MEAAGGGANTGFSHTGEMLVWPIHSQPFETIRTIYEKIGVTAVTKHYWYTVSTHRARGLSGIELCKKFGRFHKIHIDNNDN